MNYLLDTCVISDFFKKSPAVLAHFQSKSPKQLHISTISVMEIEYGLRLHLEREKKIRPIWSSFLQVIHIVPYSESCALATAFIRAHLKDKGLPIGPYDSLIAGTAYAHHLVVVSSNMSEFKRVPEITVEDWRNP